MPKYEKTTASIAASTTTNVLSGDQIQIAPYPRVVQSLAVTIRDNTPALGDVTWVLKAGPREIARGRGILENTAGAEITFPDGYSPVNMRIMPNVPLNLEVTNADSGGAHSNLVSMILDVI